MKLVENCAIECAAVPINTTGAAVAGQYISMANYNHCTIIIQQGAWAAGTPAVTLNQATTIAAGTNKALGFSFYWSQVALTGTGLVRTAVVSNTFNLTATANTTTVIEVDAMTMDIANGYVCLNCGIASPGSNADLISVHYILSEPRFHQAPPLPDPKVI